MKHFCGYAVLFTVVYLAGSMLTDYMKGERWRYETAFTSLVAGSNEK
jgi:hypothetical protein